MVHALPEGEQANAMMGGRLTTTSSRVWGKPDFAINPGVMEVDPDLFQGLDRLDYAYALEFADREDVVAVVKALIEERE